MQPDEWVLFQFSRSFESKFRHVTFATVGSFFRWCLSDWPLLFFWDSDYRSVFAREADALLSIRPSLAEPPPELRCPLCQAIFKDAVMIPCCHYSFCDKCDYSLFFPPLLNFCDERDFFSPEILFKIVARYIFPKNCNIFVTSVLWPVRFSICDSHNLLSRNYFSISGRHTARADLQMQMPPMRVRQVQKWWPSSQHCSPSSHRSLSGNSSSGKQCWWRPQAAACSWYELSSRLFLRLSFPFKLNYSSWDTV